MPPNRIRFIPICHYSPDDQMRNFEAANKYPRIGQPQAAHSRTLAICGGGNSIVSRLDEVCQYDEVWGVNDCAAWLSENGIASWACTVDSTTIPLKTHDLVIGAKLASCVDTCQFDVFKNVEVFDMSEHAAGGLPGGTTTATRLSTLGCRLGYRDIAFFGCDSSFANTTHAYYDTPMDFKEQLVIRANDYEYVTTPDYMLQAENLVFLFNEFGSVFKCKSGGLLEAMLADGQWEVVAVSDQVKRNVEDASGCMIYSERWN